MSVEPMYVPDDFGDDADVPPTEGPDGTGGPQLADPNDPDSDYLIGDWWEQRSQGRGTPTRPLVAGRCEKIRSNGSRCRQWQVHGLRYCVVHSGVRNLPNVKEFHEQTVHNARLALMRSVPAALERIEQIITDDDADIPASVRLKASTEVLDRVGVRGGTELDVRVEETEDPGAALRARLEQLRDRAVAAAHLAGSENPVIMGHVVQDDGQLDLFADEDEPS